jgi:hypothetical protein
LRSLSSSEIEDVVERLKAQHPEICVGKVPVFFSPDQVRKMLVEVSKGRPKLRVEFDCGNPVGRQCDSTSCTGKGRPMGMYVVSPDGTERPVHIGFMRVGEMKGLEELLNDVVR